MRSHVPLPSPTPLQVPGLVDQLAELSAKGCNIERLLELLVAAAFRLLAQHPHYEQLLQAMLARVQMGARGRAGAACRRRAGCQQCARGCSGRRPLVHGGLRLLLTYKPSLSSFLPPGNAGRVLGEAVLQQAAVADEQPSDAAAAAQRALHLRLLRGLDQRCPEALDAAVDAVLPAKQQQGGEGEERQGGGDEREEARRQCMMGLLNAAFEGTARCVMLEAGTTVLAAAEAPAAGMRQLVRRLHGCPGWWLPGAALLHAPGVLPRPVGGIQPSAPPAPPNALPAGGAAPGRSRGGGRTGQRDRGGGWRGAAAPPTGRFPIGGAGCAGCALPAAPAPRSRVRRPGCLLRPRGAAGGWASSVAPQPCTVPPTAFMH